MEKNERERMWNAAQRATDLLNKKKIGAPGNIGARQRANESNHGYGAAPSVILENCNFDAYHTAIRVTGPGNITFRRGGSYNGGVYGIHHEAPNQGDKLKVNQYGNGRINGGHSGVSVPAGSTAEVNQYGDGSITGGTHAVHERDSDFDALQKLLPAGTPPEFVVEAIKAIRVTQGTGEEKAEAALNTPIRKWLIEHGVDVAALGVSIAGLFISK